MIVSAGDSTPNDGKVRRVTMFAFNPKGDYFTPKVVDAALEMVWGTAIRFEGKEFDRLWVDPDQGVQARLRYVTAPYPPQLLVTLSAYLPGAGSSP